MFFDTLFQIWRKNDLMGQAVEDSKEMLEVAQDLFEEVILVVRGEKGKDKLDNIMKQDYLLNHFEKSIRKKVFEHITVNDKENQNLYTGILLVSIAVDIERMGDYCKNIAELAVLRDSFIDKKLNEAVINFLDKTSINFKKTRETYNNTDEKLAIELNDILYADKQSLDALILQIAIDQATNKNLAIYALVLRFIKRVNSHMLNLVTSITNPIDKIGYYIEVDKQVDKN